MAKFATPAGGSRPPGLIQRYREELQAHHYARRTVETYEQWLRRMLRFQQLRHPREMGSAEVNAFLTHLAVGLQVSPSIQNQVHSVLLVLDRELLERDLDLERVVAELMDGSGLRLMEALRVRVKDLDFERRELTVRDGKGSKDRRTMLPINRGNRLRHHLQGVVRLLAKHRRPRRCWGPWPRSAEAAACSQAFRHSQPTSRVPTIGASQNSHNWTTASPSTGRNGSTSTPSTTHHRSVAGRPAVAESVWVGDDVMGGHVAGL